MNDADRAIVAAAEERDRKGYGLVQAAGDRRELLRIVREQEARNAILEAVLAAAERLAYGIPGAVEFDGMDVPDEDVSVSLRRNREAARLVIAAIQPTLPTADDVRGILADRPADLNEMDADGPCSGWSSPRARIASISASTMRYLPREPLRLPPAEREAGMTDAVRKSLEQQEEYRVRDTDGEPRTEAGRRMLVGLLDYDALPPDRMGWNRDAIRAIEAEAALLARPVEPEPLPDNALYSGAVTHGYHARSGDHECREYVVGVCALPALLARRAPGDRDIAAIQESHDTARRRHAAAPNGYPDHAHCETCAVLRALAADSRPEQPRQADERDAIAKEVTRDGGRRRVWTNSGDKGATVRDADPVRPEEPPE